MTLSAVFTDRMIRLSQALETGLYERQYTVRLCLLAALCGESVFLLGPPGIAKSLIARRLKHAFHTARSFEYLMTRFSTPEEVFGPLSIQALKEEGRYERLTQGYLPDAEVVFLDEIWKAGPAILNTLLTAINERIFRNGINEKSIPLRLLVCASNELPEANSGLEALYDRLLVRVLLNPVQEKKNFQALLQSHIDEQRNPVSEILAIQEEEFHIWQEKIQQVELSAACFELIYQLRQQLKALDNPPYISDRRWKKSMRLLQAAAFFSGRNTISPVDLILLKECLWFDSDSKRRIDSLLAQLMQEQAYQQSSLLVQLQQIKHACLTHQDNQNQQATFTVKPRPRLFNRQTAYQLPSELQEETLILQLESPLRLHEILVTSLSVEKSHLETWLKKQGEIKARLNGIGFPQCVNIELNHKFQMVIFDISRQSSLLMVPGKNIQRAIPEDLKIRITDWQYHFLEQKQKFSQDQKSLFVDSEWLTEIENSFLQLSEEFQSIHCEVTKSSPSC